jgi:hypothetical protein
VRVFRTIGVLLLLGLVAWVIAAAVWRLGYQAPPRVLGIGNAFEGNLQLPAEKITAAFEAARMRMLDVNSWGTWLRLAGDFGGWLSFAATAAITLIVGFYGRAPGAAGAVPNTEGLPGRSVRMIGLLAALAAVLTACSNMASAKSGDYYKRADTMRDIIVRSRAEVIDAKTAEAAQAVLDNLALQMSR